LPNGVRGALFQSTPRAPRAVLIEEWEEAAQVGLGRAAAVLADLEGLGVLHRVAAGGAVPLAQRRAHVVGDRLAAALRAQPGKPRGRLLGDAVEDPVHPRQPLVHLRGVRVEPADLLVDHRVDRDGHVGPGEIKTSGCHWRIRRITCWRTWRFGSSSPSWLSSTSYSAMP